ncbi:hypothetical protein CDAR_552891 [Caerostris darwini]|uniref:Uncharacterized protein n=1 Tax=Caerostris darwini TaxID=1538125 RepID=A0AAV4WDF0_9ARAC|nr:hypothetical protein CDAR_552891 [Caerostris darwini]
MKESATCVNCSKMANLHKILWKRQEKFFKIARPPTTQSVGLQPCFLHQYDCRTITPRSGFYYPNAYSSRYHRNSGSANFTTLVQQKDEITPRGVAFQTSLFESSTQKMYCTNIIWRAAYIHQLNHVRVMAAHAL